MFPQSDPTDADLERAGGNRTIAIGGLTGDRRINRIPLELYVARVLTGEGVERLLTNEARGRRPLPFQLTEAGGLKRI